MGLLKNLANRMRSRAESRVESEIMRKSEELIDTAAGKIKEVKMDIKGKMIEDYDDFEAKFKTASRKPEKAVLYFLIGMYNVGSDADKGEAMATLALPTPYLVENTDSASGYKVNHEGEGQPIWDMWSDVINVQHYLGGKAKKNYELDKDGDVELKIIGKALKGRTCGLVITSADEDTQVVVNLKRNKQGQWKIFTMESPDVGSVEEGDF